MVPCVSLFDYVMCGTSLQTSLNGLNSCRYCLDNFRRILLATQCLVVCTHPFSCITASCLCYNSLCIVQNLADVEIFGCGLPHKATMQCYSHSYCRFIFLIKSNPLYVTGHLWDKVVARWPLFTGCFVHKNYSLFNKVSDYYCE